MFRKVLFLGLAALLLCGATACKKKPTAAQNALARQKAFQERQRGLAIKAYSEIVTKFPDSDYAKPAQERLSVLGPPPAAPGAVKKK